MRCGSGAGSFCIGSGDVMSSPATAGARPANRMGVGRNIRFAHFSDPVGAGEPYLRLGNRYTVHFGQTPWKGKDSQSAWRLLIMLVCDGHLAKPWALCYGSEFWVGVCVFRSKAISVACDDRPGACRIASLCSTRLALQQPAHIIYHSVFCFSRASSPSR